MSPGHKTCVPRARKCQKWNPGHERRTIKGVQVATPETSHQKHSLGEKKGRACLSSRCLPLPPRRLDALARLPLRRSRQTRGIRAATTRAGENTKKTLSPHCVRSDSFPPPSAPPQRELRQPECLRAQWCREVCPGSEWRLEVNYADHRWATVQEVLSKIIPEKLRKGGLIPENTIVHALVGLSGYCACKLWSVSEPVSCVISSVFCQGKRRDFLRSCRFFLFFVAFPYAMSPERNFFRLFSRERCMIG